PTSASGRARTTTSAPGAVPNATTTSIAPGGDTAAAATGATIAKVTGVTMNPETKRVNVVADGFGPGADVTVTLHSTPRVLGHVTADANGHISASLVLPAGVESGDHHLEVAGPGPNGDAVVASASLRLAGTSSGSNL